MPIPDPVTSAALTAGILTNIATVILEHHAQALEGTLAGRMLKWTGLVRRDFEDRRCDILSEAVNLDFETNLQYNFTRITNKADTTTTRPCFIVACSYINPVDETRASRNLGVSHSPRYHRLKHLLPSHRTWHTRHFQGETHAWNPPDLALALAAGTDEMRRVL